MFELKLPSMGADMTDAVLVAWTVAVGDRVQEGDIVCEIETAKGNIDVESWEAGVVSEILVEPGERVPVGEVLARFDTGAPGEPAIDEPGGEPTPEELPPESEPDDEPTLEEPSSSPEPVAETASTQEAVPADSREVVAPPEPTRPQTPTAATDRPGASPAAARRAAELGIALEMIAGSGPHGAIKLEDVEREHAGREAPHAHRRVTPVARKMAAAAGLDVDRVEATGAQDTVTRADVERALGPPQPGPPGSSDDALRDAIAKAMAKSKREIPHYYLATTIDVSRPLEWMKRRNSDRPVGQRLVFGALVARAVALAARDVPEMNGFYENDHFQPGERVHLGFAVAMRNGGVVAPALLNLTDASIDETMAAIKDVVRRVRGGKLRSSEMTESTITLTSLGDVGVDTVFGVIYPPQVAIVGFGTPREVPIARDGLVGTHMCADITLSGDHRVSDGLAGARFLRRIQHHLDQPEDP